MATEFHEIPQKWLITGGCGFIGTNLIDYLVQYTDANIRIIDNLSGGKKENITDICQFDESNKALEDIDEHVQHWVEDVLDEDIAIEATKDIDCIVHLAANTGVIPSI